MRQIIIILMVFILCLSSICFVHAAELEDITLPPEVDGDDYILFRNGQSLYLWDNVTIVEQDYNIEVAAILASGQTSYKFWPYVKESGVDQYVNNSSTDYVWKLRVKDGCIWEESPGSYKFSNQIEFTEVLHFPCDLYYEGERIYIGNSGNTELPDVENSDPSDPTDPSDPNEPLDPTIPSDGSDSGSTDDSETGGAGGSFDQPGLLSGIGNFFENLWQNISNFFTGLFDGFKSFLSELFEPVTSFFKDLTDWKEHAGSIGDIWNSLDDYTSKPIEDFMDSLNIDTIAFVTSIWELPIIKDIMMAIVAIMVLGAIVIFLGGGI